MDEVKRYLSKCSPRFVATFDRVRRSVLRVFPDAEEVFLFRMPGWKVARKVPPPKAWKGTLDPRYVVILLAERKTGITLHFWNPAKFGFDAHRAALEQAGFTLMVGCLQFRRKGEYPVGVLEALFLDAKASANA